MSEPPISAQLDALAGASSFLWGICQENAGPGENVMPTVVLTALFLAYDDPEWLAGVIASVAPDVAATMRLDDTEGKRAGMVKVFRGAYQTMLAKAVRSKRRNLWQRRIEL